MANKLVIDVSNNRPMTISDLRKANPDGLICKATEGSTFVDATYDHHRAIAKEVGIPFGGYLYLHPQSPGNEAEFFLQHAKPKVGDLQPVIDAEVKDKADYIDVANRIESCAAVLKKHGYTPILYTGADFWKQLFAVKPHLKWMQVWEAQYPVSKLTKWFPWLSKMRIRLLNGVTVVMWQWTDDYEVNGKYFDASRLFVDINTLRIKNNV